MSRAEQTKTERRRRNSNALGGGRQKLSISGELDTQNFSYRWVNDEGNRLHDLTTNDDWEVVSDRSGALKPGGSGVGSEVAQPVGVGGDGRQTRAVLLRKPKDYYNDDESAKQRRIDETESGLKAGAVPGSDGDKSTYVPKSGIVFEGGARS